MLEVLNGFTDYGKLDANYLPNAMQEFCVESNIKFCMVLSKIFKNP